MAFVGVGGGFGHDASVAVVQDGRLVLVVEEERVTRSKGARGLIPERALDRALTALSLSPDDVRHVAFAWDPALDPSNDRMAAASAAVRQSRRFTALAGRPWTFLPHHDCHSAAALAMARRATDARTAVVVMDGRGELASTSVYAYDANAAPYDAERAVATSPLAASLGTFFAAATAYCGFGPDGAGKTMGLAAFGTPDSRFKVPLSVTGLAVAVADMRQAAGMDATAAHRAVYRDWINRFERHFGPAGERIPNRKVDGYAVHGSSADAAATAQHVLELLVADLLAELQTCVRPDRVLLTGGVALNCAMNGVLRRRHPNLVLNPIPHDAGVSIGAAVLASAAAGEPVEPNPSPYLGQGWNDEELARAAGANGLRSWHLSDLEAEVAQRLTQGQTVGWFQGRAEIGPRALGHRSILGRAGDPATRAKLNTVKGREQWRPLGPSMTARAAGAAFGGDDFPYMIEAAHAAPGPAASLVSAVHVDGTCRPHVPSSGTSPRYGRLLAEVGRTGDAEAVVNTSFNTGDEPVVNSPDDAVATFLKSELDVLCLGPVLAVREGTVR